MVVRHPMTRFLSAYWDKMYTTDKNSLYHLIRTQLLRNARPDLTKQQVESLIPTFQEFVEYRMLHYLPYSTERHWGSIIKLCRPCTFRYHYTFKLETIKQEIQPILRRLVSKNITYEHLASMIVPKNIKSRKSFSLSAMNGKVIEEYMNLTLQQRKDIGKVFKKDMEMFGYHFNPWTAAVEYDVNECNNE